MWKPTSRREDLLAGRYSGMEQSSGQTRDERIAQSAELQISGSEMLVRFEASPQAVVERTG